MNQLVKEFYNLNPYPRVIIPVKRTLLPGTFENYYKILNRPVPQKPRILIAGCGTVSTAAIANSYTSAEIIYAVDISEKAIEIAKRSCSKLMKPEIRWIVADISSTDFTKNILEHNFDWIHCTGTLHHLENPSAGINNLSQLLSDDGIIKCQVYSKGARLFIEWARAAFKSKNAKNTADVKYILDALTDSHPFRFALSTYPESLTEPGLKDGFLHPLVNTFYANEWGKMFNDNELELSCWKNLNYIKDAGEIFPVKLYENFKKLKLTEQITIMEKLGEWRSDFNFIASKQTGSKTEKLPDRYTKTDIIIKDNHNISYSRYYMWHEFKSALKLIDSDLDANQMRGIINHLSPKCWGNNLKSLMLRFKWSAWKDEARKNASINNIFSENIDELLEDYFNNDHKQKYYIPSAFDWEWKQWQEGFFNWKI
jgi:SAM-dependent methyltransferase